MMTFVSVKRICLMAFLTVVFSIAAFSQAVVVLDKGFLFINNAKDKSFTLEIVGSEVKTLKSSVPMFTVDGRILQINIVPLSNFAAKGNKFSDAELLAKHEKWESDYLADEVYKTKLVLDSEAADINDRKTLFWGFTRPSENKQFDRDYFLSTIVGNNLVALGSPLKIGEKKADTQKMLTDLFKTLKVSEKAFDIQKIADEVKNKKKESPK